MHFFSLTNYRTFHISIKLPFSYFALAKLFISLWHFTSSFTQTSSSFLVSSFHSFCCKTNLSSNIFFVQNSYFFLLHPFYFYCLFFPPSSILALAKNCQFHIQNHNLSPPFISSLHLSSETIDSIKFLDLFFFQVYR